MKTLITITLCFLSMGVFAQMQVDKKIEMTGATPSDKKIEGIEEVVNSHDAANKEYVDTAIANRASSGSNTPTLTFSFSADTNTVTGYTGSRTTAYIINLTLTQTGGAGAPVSLSASGVPSGVTAVFGPSGGYPSFNSDLYFEIDQSAIPGTYNVVLSATGAATTPTVNVTLNIVAGKLVFLSSTSHQGNFGGVSVAHAECQNLASAAGLSGTYKAWIADGNSSTGPSSHFTQFSGPYVLRTGTVIADNWSDMTDGNLDNNWDRDENGLPLPTPPDLRTWSNVLANGTRWTTNEHCSNWTSTSGSGRTGVPARPWNSDWSNDNAYGCSQFHRFYCVQQ